MFKIFLLVCVFFDYSPSPENASSENDSDENSSSEKGAAYESSSEKITEAAFSKDNL